MAKSEFVYVTYIRTTLENLWNALLDPEFTRRYWFGSWQECAWKPGAPWQIKSPEGVIRDSGQVVEFDPPRRFVLSWRNEFRPELRAEGYSRMTCTLEPAGESIKLTIHHEIDRLESKFIEAVSNGWPSILSSLKSLLETGEALVETHRNPAGS